MTLEYADNDAVAATYPGGRWLQFESNAAGLRTAILTSDGYELHYAYTPGLQLESLADGNGAELAHYEYDLRGRIVRRTLGNGCATEYGYDPAGVVALVVNRDPDGTVISQWDYTRDALGNPMAIESDTGTSLFGHDELGQLLSHVGEDAAETAYLYDRCWNRVSVQDGQGSVTYQTNAMNQYTSAGAANFTYDADGNLRSRTDGSGTSTYAYDEENRLVRVVLPGGVGRTIAYDALGNPISVTRDGVTTHLLYDPSGMGNAVAEYADDGSLLARNVFGTELVARSAPGAQPRGPSSTASGAWSK